jgi:lipoprotein signal peptidase
VSDESATSTGAAAGLKEARAMSTFRSPTAWILMLSVLAAGLAFDLWSKYWAFGTLAGRPVVIDKAMVLAGRHHELIPPNVTRVIVPSLLEFKLVLNVGAVFGAGEGKRWLFIAVTVFAVFFGLFLFGYWTRAKDRMAHLAIGLTYGCVRDFIHPFPGVHLPFGMRWPGGDNELWPYVSNVADKFLLIGIVILLWHAWMIGDGDAPPAKPCPGSPSQGSNAEAAASRTGGPADAGATGGG